MKTPSLAIIQFLFQLWRLSAFIFRLDEPGLKISLKFGIYYHLGALLNYGKEAGTTDYSKISRSTKKMT